MIFGALKRTFVADLAAYFTVAVLLTLVSLLGLESGVPEWVLVALYFGLAVVFYRRFFLHRRSPQRRQ